MTDHDLILMQRALRLARKGLGRVSPNPLVGAVIVKNGRILAEGYHKRFGGPHAEVNALSHLEEGLSKGSTVYVTLEPCCHTGKTPPCTNALLQARVQRVVVGMIDPNPVVSGRGIQILRDHGMDVTVGILETECRELNAPYIKAVTRRQPYITLKIAQTIDGNIATRKGLSRWITGDTSRRWVHKLRSENDAVMVGVGTVLADNPHLTVRMVRGRSPRRIVLDSHLRIPDVAHLVSDKHTDQTIVVTGPSADTRTIQTLQNRGVQVWTVETDSAGQIRLNSLWERLVDAGIYSILVEGGREVFTSCLRSGETDRLIVITAPKIVGDGISSIGNVGVETMDQAISLRQFKTFRKGTDWVMDGRL